MGHKQIRAEQIVCGFPLRMGKGSLCSKFKRQSHETAAFICRNESSAVTRPRPERIGGDRCTMQKVG